MSCPPVNLKSAALLKKYSLQPAPASVARLAQLVVQRANDRLEEIAKVVAGDPALKVRLLHAATPKDGDPIEDVEQAIFRCGVEAVLVLAMADPLLRAVHRTFEGLLGMKLEAVDDVSIDPMDVAGYLATVRFTGRANGRVFLRMRETFGQRIAGKLLTAPPDTMTAHEIIDVLGEIGNTIAGNFNSNLCDAGLSCKLSVPEVKPGNEFDPPKIGLGRHQRYAFRHEGLPLFIHIIVESTE